MKISDMSVVSSKKISKVAENRYGLQIDFSKMTALKARKMLSSINETISQVRHSHSIHRAEKNPKYMNLLMVREGLTNWVKENSRRLIESEVGQAEALLAAKDMVDSIQDMLEKIGKMQIEQLPALTDSIRDQIGSEQSVQFKGSVGQVLTDLVAQMNQAREAVDNASRALSGEQSDMDMGMPDAGMGGDLDLGMGADAGMPGDDAGIGAPDLGMGGDEFGATDAAAGGDDAIGREKR